MVYGIQLPHNTTTRPTAYPNQKTISCGGYNQYNQIYSVISQNELSYTARSKKWTPLPYSTLRN